MTSFPTRAAEPAPSLWQATAPAGPALPRFRGDLNTDVAIVGAGFTGLAAARHLLRAGTGCVVLEANDVGWGASGRNAGFLVPRYKRGFAALAAGHGPETARRLRALLDGAIDGVEGIVAEYGIACDFRRCGQIIAAHSARAMAGLRTEVEWLRRHAGDDGRTRLLGPDEVRAETGSPTFFGGLLDPTGAAFHPLRYVRGLAAKLAASGVPIHVGSPVTTITETGGRVILETPGGRVRAHRAVLATNAYTALALRFSDLHRRIVPVATSAVATRPLSPNLAARVTAGGRMVSDTRRLMSWFRLLPDNRLMFGGRADLTGRRADRPSAYAGLERALAAAFPDLPPLEVEYRWSGMMAMTLTDFPHLGRLGDRVYYALGYGGRGVALSHRLGADLARAARGEPVDIGPVSAGELRPIPLHALRVPGMRLLAGYYRLRDRWWS